MSVLEYLLLAEMTIVTGIAVGSAVIGLVAIKTAKSVVGPIIGLINMFGAK